jgi:hypothetical protein
MAALTATAFTETVESRVIEGKHKRNRVKLAMSATQDLTYPSSGGIPLPTTMGMTRNIDYVIIVQAPMTTGQPPANNFLWSYDLDNHSLRGYQQPATSAAIATGFAELPTTFKPSLVLGLTPVMYVEAVGW